MADLVERLRGPVREAASRLIAGAFRRDGERLEEKRPRFSIPARPEEDDDLILIAALEEAAAALEAEASKGERRGLERAIALVERGGFDISVRLDPKQDKNLSDWFRRQQLAALRALIPEAPVREGWMPIETAPKDGTVVWLFEPHDMGGFMFAGAVNADGVWINNLDLKVQNPTHWRPLPAPPQDNREG